jgi:hypothetical protein
MDVEVMWVSSRHPTTSSKAGGVPTPEEMEERVMEGQGRWEWKGNHG